MKKVGIVICNYNKADYVLKCIASVLESEYTDYDLYVVDNASSDGSVEAIEKTYGERVTILQNQENLGGSGGFNTGLRKVLEGDYRYVCCLDNDVQVTPTEIGKMRKCLEQNKQVGMVGSKVFHMQMPDYVQQMGLKIHFDTFSAETLYADQKDGDTIPEVVYCDTVAACSLMLPVAVLREVGMMPEDNFIYWDDMEWGYRVSRAGYQVAAIGASKVYHEMSANVRRETTFSIYYLWRNQLHFFMKYTPGKLRDRMVFVLLQRMFQEIYESMFREEHNVASTLQYALFDAMMGVRGKAAAEKILPNDKSEKRVRETLARYEKICVIDTEKIGLQEALQELAPGMQFVEEAEAQVVWRSCPYIMTLTDFSGKDIYVDPNWNILVDEEDIPVIRQYGYSLQLFLYMHQDAFRFQSNQMSQKTEVQMETLQE